MEAYEFDLYVAKKMYEKQKNATQRGIEFKLTFQSMKNLYKAKRCYYTGIELTRTKGINPCATDLTIDRLDSSKGYVPGNVVAACHAANQFKGMFENPNYVINPKQAKSILQYISKKKGTNNGV